MEDGLQLKPGAANVTLGGPENNIIYIMADVVIGAAEIKARGAGRA